MSSVAEKEVMELYQTWTRAWLTVDPELMLSLYDLESGDLVYQSEENVGPIYSGDQLRAYWAAAKEIVHAVPIWAEKSKKIVVAEEYAFIYVLLDTKLISPAFGGEIVGEMRATIGCRKRNGKWEIIHYHEGRQMEAAAAAGVQILGS